MYSALRSHKERSRSENYGDILPFVFQDIKKNWDILFGQFRNESLRRIFVYGTLKRSSLSVGRMEYADFTSLRLQVRIPVHAVICIFCH